MNQEMVMMKNKGSNPDKIKSESQLVMRGLCSEPLLDSFYSILIFKRFYA